MPSAINLKPLLIADSKDRVVEDKMRGTVIKVELHDMTKQSNVTRILNYYPFHFEINGVIQVVNATA